jgi:hypothetical protein
LHFVPGAAEFCQDHQSRRSGVIDTAHDGRESRTRVIPISADFQGF